MSGFDNIDFSTGKLNVSLHTAEPLKNDDSLRVAWSATGESFTSFVIYGEYRVRDWRWLWLRKRTVSRLLDYQTL